MIAIALTLVLLFVLTCGVRIAVGGHRLWGWGMIAFAALGIPLVWAPDIATRIANFAGVGRGADLLLYMLFVVVVVLLVPIHGHLRNHQRVLTELVRREALARVSRRCDCDEP
jgi:hypothetical protein